MCRKPVYDSKQFRIQAIVLCVDLRQCCLESFAMFTGLDQEDAAFVYISIIIFVFGILANLFVIALLMIEKKFLKSSTHW